MRAAKDAGLPRLAIRQALTKSNPHLSRGAEIARAVGLEPRVGKPTSGLDQATSEANVISPTVAEHIGKARDCTRRALEHLDRAVEEVGDVDAHTDGLDRERHP